MKKRLYILIIAGLLLIFLFSGCKNNKISPLREGSTPNPNKITIITKITITPLVGADSSIIDDENINKKRVKVVERLYDGNANDLLKEMQDKKQELNEVSQWLLNIEADSFYAFEVDPVSKLSLIGLDFFNEKHLNWFFAPRYKKYQTYLRGFVLTMIDLKPGNIYYFDTISIQLDDNAYGGKDDKKYVEHIIPKNIEYIDEFDLAETWVKNYLNLKEDTNILRIKIEARKIDVDSLLKTITG